MSAAASRYMPGDSWYPISVCVFPLPVAPRAKIVLLVAPWPTPANSRSTSGCTASVYTRAFGQSASKTSSRDGTGGSRCTACRRACSSPRARAGWIHRRRQRAAPQLEHVGELGVELLLDQGPLPDHDADALRAVEPRLLLARRRERGEGGRGSHRNCGRTSRCQSQIFAQRRRAGSSSRPLLLPGWGAGWAASQIWKRWVGLCASRWRAQFAFLPEKQTDSCLEATAHWSAARRRG